MRALLSTFVAASFAVPPAHATGTITANYAFTFQKVGTGYVGVLFCEGAATGVTTFDVPVVTSVECDLAGTKTTGASPGARAYTGSVSVVIPPFEVCSTATASFFQALTTERYSLTIRNCRTITSL